MRASRPGLPSSTYWQSAVKFGARVAPSLNHKSPGPKRGQKRSGAARHFIGSVPGVPSHDRAWFSCFRETKTFLALQASQASHHGRRVIPSMHIFEPFTMAPEKTSPVPGAAIERTRPSRACEIERKDTGHARSSNSSSDMDDFVPSPEIFDAKSMV